MFVPTSHVLPLLGIVCRSVGPRDVSLGALARMARRPPHELHRAFLRVTGETPKRYTARLRLDHAAAQLLAGDAPILEIALASGFASHEVFTRAFLRRFGMSPRAYRARGLVATPRAAREMLARHVAVVREVGPCIGLFHLTVERKPLMSVTVTRTNFEPRPALVIRRKTAAADIAKTLGEILPRVFEYAQRKGIPFAGPPFTRYLPGGRILLTIEAGLPIAAAAQGEGDIVVIELPGGPAANAIHHGAYDTLEQTHLAIERWIDDQKLEVSGAPWESYLTDPGETPNPSDWQTQVVYPLAR
jgi:AraC family transcriptional regulator